MVISELTEIAMLAIECSVSWLSLISALEMALFSTTTTPFLQQVNYDAVVVVGCVTNSQRFFTFASCMDPSLSMHVSLMKTLEERETRCWWIDFAGRVSRGWGSQATCRILGCRTDIGTCWRKGCLGCGHCFCHRVSCCLQPSCDFHEVDFAQFCLFPSYASSFWLVNSCLPVSD